ncbi:MAG: CehA/McbA family metallohydrolase [Thermoprotei archaeon]|nr:CehA/McbA family metallohydrolase [Thermoprotei archaeon]
MYKISSDKSWIKGSLHCHSTASDGRLAPEDVIEYYAHRGYHLVSITDHEKITNANSRSIITLSGVELSRGKSRLGEPYHVVALGVDDPHILKLREVQDVIDAVNSMGGLALIAHPYWSSLTHGDLMDIEGYIAIEIYNTGCDVEVGKGYSTVHWDGLLSRGLMIWGVAVDDAHRYFMYPIDADGGWIWIDVPEEDEEAVMKSLKEGRFYSSTGPMIQELELTDELLHIEATPAARVNIISHNGRGICIHESFIPRILEMWSNPEGRRELKDLFDNLEVTEEKGLKRVFVSRGAIKLEISYGRRGLEAIHIEGRLGHGYVRVEVIDREGKVAWTNPIRLNQ